MKDLAAYIGSKPGTADGYAIGADNFAKMILTNEAVDTPLDELERIGQADLKRNQDALKAACATYTAGMTITDRSEEHTSELQSLMRISYAVFCLKKQTTKQTNTTK